MADRVRVTIDLKLTLLLTRRQARRASSDEFKARLRSALAFSSAREALTEALDLDVASLTLREDGAQQVRAAIQDPAAPTASGQPVQPDPSCAPLQAPHTNPSPTPRHRPPCDLDREE
jgi:hypothetical protein